MRPQICVSTYGLPDLLGPITLTFRRPGGQPLPEGSDLLPLYTALERCLPDD